VRGARLSLISGAALKRVNPTLCAKPRKDFGESLVMIPLELGTVRADTTGSTA
jgi:hypothetical protein